MLTFVQRGAGEEIFGREQGEARGTNTKSAQKDKLRQKLDATFR